MPRRRFFVSPENIKNGIATPSPEEIHHLRDVLRLRSGDVVEIFDGKGNAFLGRVQIQGAAISLSSLERIEAARESQIGLVLALALSKGNRFEWALQKATELGVEEFMPLMTRFCGVRIAESKLPDRLKRWQRIVREAAKQCGRSMVPKIRRPCEFAEFLAYDPYPEAAKFLFYERATRLWDEPSITSERMVLCIGPEGGWEPAEVEAAGMARYRVFSLGPRVLRTETAALAAVAILQFRHGDLGPHRIDD